MALAWFAAASAACAAITGLADYAETDDAGLRQDSGKIEAGHAETGPATDDDAPITTDDDDAPITVDATDAAPEAAPDQSAEATIGDDGSEGNADAAPPVEASIPEAGPDAPPDVSIPEAGSCGCSHCCGALCAVKHTNGVGQTFYDCALTGTFNVNTARDACNASTGGTGCTTQTLVCGLDGNQAVMCASSSSDCTCWGYNLSAAGHVHSSGVGNFCVCPGGVDPTWN